MEAREQENYDRALKRVQKIKGFYVHFMVYAIINLALLISIYLAVGDADFWQFGHFLTPLFWGIGLLLHWLNAFDYTPVLGRKWEARKIREFMEREQEESGKYH
jgi:hypothetical protein